MSGKTIELSAILVTQKANATLGVKSPNITEVVMMVNKEFPALKTATDQ